MEFSIKDIAEANLPDIPESCKGCIYWEFPEEFDKAEEERTELEKKIGVRAEKA